MSETKRIQYILIGDCKNNGIIAEFPKKSKINKDATKIFENLNNTEYNKPNEKFKILSQDGHFYFTLTNSRIFYLVYANDKCPDRIAFDLIEELEGEEKNFTKKKNFNFNFESLVENYETKEDSISTAQSQINAVKNDMTVSLHKMIGNMDSLKDIEGKSMKIKDTSILFKNEAIKVRNNVLRNKIIAAVVIVLAIVFVLYIIFF